MSNAFMYKFEIIESVIKALDFKTKEEVVALIKKMRDIAIANETYSPEVKKAFEDAYKEIASDTLTLENLKEIKNLVND